MVKLLNPLLLLCWGVCNAMKRHAPSLGYHSNKHTSIQHFDATSSIPSTSQLQPDDQLIAFLENVLKDPNVLSEAIRVLILVEREHLRSKEGKLLCTTIFNHDDTKWVYHCDTQSGDVFAEVYLSEEAAYLRKSRGINKDGSRKCVRGTYESKLFGMVGSFLIQCFKAELYVGKASLSDTEHNDKKRSVMTVLRFSYANDVEKRGYIHTFNRDHFGIDGASKLRRIAIILLSELRNDIILKYKRGQRHPGGQLQDHEQPPQHLAGRWQDGQAAHSQYLPHLPYMSFAPPQPYIVPLNTLPLPAYLPPWYLPHRPQPRPYWASPLWLNTPPYPSPLASLHSRQAVYPNRDNRGLSQSIPRQLPPTQPGIGLKTPPHTKPESWRPYPEPSPP